MCPPPPFKKGDQILKMSKGGGPEKKFGQGETKRGEKNFKMKGGNPTVQVEYRDRNGQNWGLFETN